MRNTFPIQKALDILLVTDQREIWNSLFSVLLFDPITHLFPRSAMWVKVGLQEDHGAECALKTPTRLIMWCIFLFRWGHTERHQSLESENTGADVWWPGFKSYIEATEPGKSSGPLYSIHFIVIQTFVKPTYSIWWGEIWSNTGKYVA